MSYGKASLAVSAVVAVLAVPVAFGKGKPPTKGLGCKPMVTVLLKGILTTDPEGADTTFTMNVTGAGTGANKHGKNLVGSSVQILTDANTMVRRRGAKTLAALEIGDRAVVQLRRCKGDLPLSADTVNDVAAARITAKPPSTPEP